MADDDEALKTPTAAALFARVDALVAELRRDAIGMMRMHADALGGDQALVARVSEVDAALETAPTHKAFPVTVAFSLGYNCAETDSKFAGALLAVIAGRCAYREGRASLAAIAAARNGGDEEDKADG